MKILHVEAGMHLYGGARQVHYLLRGLAGSGVRNLLAIPEGSELGEQVSGDTAQVFALPMAGDLDVGLIFRLKRLIDRERPDLVHLHSRRGADLFGGIAARLAGVPALLTRRVDNPETGLAIRFKYPLFRKVVTISEGIREVLLRQGVPAERVVCIRSAVDAKRYRTGCDREWFVREFGLQADTRAVAVVAQLISRKGHRYLLKAMPELLDRFPNLHLLLFGKGPLEAEISKQIHALGLDRHVTLAGFRDDLPRIFSCLELLVHPALIEGLGVSLLQAASAGLPIVASDAGGMPEAVRHGVNGLLVPPGHVSALGDAIGRLLDEPAMARRMGQSGARLMQDEFSVERMVADNLALYRQLLSRDPEALSAS
jgi:glycosyltransferase involved in cell wall biosynthesis